MLIVRTPCPDCRGTGDIYFESKNHPGYWASNDCEQCDCEGYVDFGGAVLAHNLAIAGALCRSYELGGAACWCDYGPIGNEWYPGMGCTPESIADRRWNDDPHDFRGGGDERCVECGRDADWYLHVQCPECFAILGECNGEHAPGCGRSAP